MRVNINSYLKNNAVFYVNKNKRTVACVINDTEDFFREFIESNCRISVSINLLYGHCDLSSEYDRFNDLIKRMPNSFSGVAHCAEEDTFNEELGKQIAFNKMCRKFMRSLAKHRQNYIAYISRALIEFTSNSCTEINKVKNKIGDEA